MLKAGLLGLTVFGGFDDGNEYLDQFVYVTIDICKLPVVQIAGLVQKFDPIGGFVRFLQRNVQFSNEVRFTLSANRFSAICPDARPAPEHLF